MVLSNKKADYNDGRIGFCLNLSGFQIDHIIVSVDPKMTLKAFVETIVDKFNLEQVDSCGFVGFHVLSIGDRPAGILKYYGEDGNPLTFEDQGIGNGEDLCLFYAPGGSSIYEMPNETQDKRDIAPEITPISESLPIILTIDGSPSVTVQVKVNDPYMTIRDLIADFVSMFSIPMTDSCGLQLKYMLGIEAANDEDEPLILEFEDNLGREQCLLDYNIQPGDHLHLVGVPVPKTEIEIIKTSHEDEYFVFLTIDGTEYENVPVKIWNPFKSIREQIESIVSVFELQKLDGGGNPIKYLLGQIMENDQEPEILEFEDEEGRDNALVDFNIQPGDHLHLVSVPLVGTRFADLFYICKKKFWNISYQKLMRYEVFPGFQTSYISTKNRIDKACKELNLPVDDDIYSLYKVERLGHDEINLIYLPHIDSKSKETFLDDFFGEEDYGIFTEKPMLVLLSDKMKISKRIYNQLKKIYNGKRRNVRR